VKETGPAECSNLVGHGRLTVQKNTKVVHNSGERNHGVWQIKILDRDLIELLASTQPDDLCLVFIKLQMIAGHPVTDPCDARLQTAETIHCFMTINSWSADVSYNSSMT